MWGFFVRPSHLEQGVQGRNFIEVAHFLFIKSFQGCILWTCRFTSVIKHKNAKSSVPLINTYKCYRTTYFISIISFEILVVISELPWHITEDFSGRVTLVTTNSCLLSIGASQASWGTPRPSCPWGILDCHRERTLSTGHACLSPPLHRSSRQFRNLPSSPSPHTQNQITAQGLTTERQIAAGGSPAEAYP